MSSSQLAAKLIWCITGCLAFALPLFGQQTSSSSQSSTSSMQQAYEPPVFTDSNRLEKIKAVLPELEKIYQAYAETNDFPGFSYGLVVDGELLWTGNTGTANVEKEIQASSQSVFRMASMSKSFTAMAILQLRDAGKLNLDDPASKYIAQLKDIDYLTTDSQPITIRNLMSHSAGFPEDNPWGDRQLDDTNEELLNLVKEGLSFSNTPGVAYEYSNLGFALLGNIVGQVSGMPYQEYINENIFQPLGMTHTYWEYADVPADLLAHGYKKVDDQWQNEELLHNGSYGAMGGLLTTVEDFSKYVALHLSAWPPRNDDESQVLKRSSLREMHQLWRFGSLNTDYQYPDGRSCPTVSGYTYGLSWVKDCDGVIRVGHSGGLPGFGSNWIILPDYGIGFMCFANRTYAPTSSANIQAMDKLMQLASLQPRSLPVSPILEKRKEDLLAFLPDWKNAETSDIFADNFFLDKDLATLKKETQELFEKAGAIQKVQSIQPQNNLRGTFVLEGEKAALSVFFSLTPENNPHIQAFSIKEITDENKEAGK